LVNSAAIIDLKQRFIAEAEREGFVAVGFAPAVDDPLRGQRLDAWLADGAHGDMAWMADRADVRRGPAAMWPEANSVIALGMSYAPTDDPTALAGQADRARISVYAQGADYHDILKKAMKRLARWLAVEARKAGLGEPRLKLFVDTAPVMEKPLAAEAGLGWQGKHTNLVSRTHGSWLFLGAIYSEIPFPADTPHDDRCGSCNACQTACPTQAFDGPYRLDARRCISYLTIELKGPIPLEFRKALGNHIYGCDDCLAACPWNKFAATAARHKAFLPRAELTAPRLGDLITLDDAGFRALFSGSPIKRVGRDRFVRNCLIAAGNSGDAGLVQPVRALLDDPDPVVAEAAHWALGELEKA
jgi:epoxyqueuosine reductase